MDERVLDEEQLDFDTTTSKLCKIESGEIGDEQTVLQRRRTGSKSGQ